MSIQVKCRTNVDEGKWKNWPTEIVCRPFVGDGIAAVDSDYELKICKITFKSALVADKFAHLHEISYLELQLSR